jgi:hypothetical protein
VPYKRKIKVLWQRKEGGLHRYVDGHILVEFGENCCGFS